MPRTKESKGVHPVDAYVGARIRLRRNVLGISQTEIAHRIGVTFQQLQKYEKGANRVGASRIVQICNALQVTPAWLFEGAPGARPKATASLRDMDAAFAALQADEMAPRLMMVWPRLPLRLRRTMVELMTAVVRRAT